MRLPDRPGGHEPEGDDDRPLNRPGPAPEGGDDEENQQRCGDEDRLAPGEQPERRPLVAHVGQVDHVRQKPDRLLLDHGGAHHGLGELVDGESEEHRDYEDPARMDQV